MTITSRDAITTTSNISDIIHEGVTEKANYSKDQEVESEIFWSKENVPAEVISG